MITFLSIYSSVSIIIVVDLKSEDPNQTGGVKIDIRHRYTVSDIPHLLTCTGRAIALLWHWQHRC